VRDSPTNERPGRSGAKERSRLLGALSIGSGLVLLVRPRSAGALYGLPSCVRMLRALGARDVAIGWLLISRRTQPLGCTLRGMADAFDLGLITLEAARGPRPGYASALQVLGALSLVALDLTLAARTQQAATRRAVCASSTAHQA
jgi:hypothetical protein